MCVSTYINLRHTLRRFDPRCHVKCTWQRERSNASQDVLCLHCLGEFSGWCCLFALYEMCVFSVDCAVICRHGQKSTLIMAKHIRSTGMNWVAVDAISSISHRSVITKDRVCVQSQTKIQTVCEFVSVQYVWESLLGFSCLQPHAGAWDSVS